MASPTRATVSPPTRAAPEDVLTDPVPSTEVFTDPPMLPLLDVEAEAAGNERFTRGMALLTAATSRDDTVKAMDEILWAFGAPAGFLSDSQPSPAPASPAGMLILLKLWELISVVQLCVLRMDVDFDVVVDFIVAVFAPFVSFQLLVLMMICSGLLTMSKVIGACVKTTTALVKFKVAPMVATLLQAMLRAVLPLVKLLYLAVVYAVVRTMAFFFTPADDRVQVAVVANRALLQEKLLDLLLVEEGGKLKRSLLATILVCLHRAIQWITRRLESASKHHKSEDVKPPKPDKSTAHEATARFKPVASSPACQ